jgi:hypothetical protein
MIGVWSAKWCSSVAGSDQGNPLTQKKNQPENEVFQGLDPHFRP